nr:hypothetical protein [Tanacetum cinerariifolium]
MQSTFDQLSKTYSPSTTKSRPGRTSFRDRSRGRSRPHRLDASNGDRPENKECFRGVGELYDNSHSSYGTGINHGYRYHDRDHSRHMKRGRDSESPLSIAAAQVKRWAMPTWCHIFNSTLIGAARVWFDELPPESIDSYKGIKAAFLAYFMQQKKYVKDPVEIHNIKQKDGETIKDFIEITFPSLATSSGTEGPLVIETEISGHMIHRMYVDEGSSTEVLYEHCFNQLRPKVKNQMVPATTSLAGFNGETIWPLGRLRLLVTTGYANHFTRAWMNFMIVRSLSPYNGIIGRPEIPKEAGVRHKNFKVALHSNFPDQEVAIKGTLSTKGRTKLCSLLKENLNIFAWQLSDMTGVPRSVAEHRLNIREGYSPVRQKKRGQAPERAKAIQADVQKLVEAGIMREVYYHDWLSNPIMKLTGKLNLSAATLSSVSWTLTKAITRYSWQSQMRRKQLFTLAKGFIAIQKCHSASRTLASRTKGCGQSLQQPKWAITKMERHDGRTQYHIPAKDVGKRTGPSGFLCRNAGRKSARRISSRNSTRAVDTLHGCIVMCRWMGVQDVHVSVDSTLVANQVLGAYVAKEENMIKYPEKVKSLVLVEILKEKSIQEKEVTTVVEEDGPTRSFLTPWLRCVRPLQADYVIREIHEGTCSTHAGPRSVVAKAIRLGYYWPTMHRDARDMIRTCNDCQIHHPATKSPQQPLTPIKALWPFYKWGTNIASPFSEAPSKVKFLIVAMDYFTKWIEAKAVATITGNQSNGLVERANWSLGEVIKAHLGEENKNWVEGLPHVLWAHRTMIKSSHGDTSFSLTYGTEAIIPAEIGMPTYCTATVDVIHNDEKLQLNLDLLEERRERAAIPQAKAKLKMTKYYNARVRDVTFRPGDFVYRSNDVSHAVDGGKLKPKWEGPYEVTKVLGDGAYNLRSMDGKVLPRT